MALLGFLTGRRDFEDPESGVRLAKVLQLYTKDPDFF